VLGIAIVSLERWAEHRGSFLTVLQTGIHVQYPYDRVLGGLDGCIEIRLRKCSVRAMYINGFAFPLPFSRKDRITCCEDYISMMQMGVEVLSSPVLRSKMPYRKRNTGLSFLLLPTHLASW
jgi:hypothetical protein